MRHSGSLQRSLDKVRNLAADRSNILPKGYSLQETIGVLFRPNAFSGYHQEYYLGPNVDDRIRERSRNTRHRIDTMYLFVDSERSRIKLPYMIDRFNQEKYRLIADPPEQLIPAEIKARTRRRRL